MINSESIAKAATKFVGSNFHLGDPARGWDCLSSLLSFYRAFGFEFPKELEGINETNYPEVWRKDNRRARDIFSRFLSSLGHPVGDRQYIPGDLLIFRGQKLPAFPAIALGNGHMFMIFPEKEGGPQVCAVEALIHHLAEVRRLIKE